MDLSERLTERFGSPAERFFVSKRKGEVEKAEEILKNLLPGDEIELPISFKVSHSVHLSFWGDIPWDNKEIEVHANSLQDLETQLISNPLPDGISEANADRSKAGDPNFLYLNYFGWDVVFESPKPFDVEKTLNISDTQLRHFSELIDFPNIARFAKLLIGIRKFREEERLSAAERSKKEAEKREISDRRKKIENDCLDKFNQDMSLHLQSAWIDWQKAIGNMSVPLSVEDRKKFAIIANNSPFATILFYCLDVLQDKNSPPIYSLGALPPFPKVAPASINFKDIEASFEALTNKSRCRIATTLYGREN